MLCGGDLGSSRKFVEWKNDLEVEELNRVGVLRSKPNLTRQVGPSVAL